MERDTIDLLKELVAIDSQNPSLVPGAAGDGTIAGYAADLALRVSSRTTLARAPFGG